MDIYTKLRKKQTLIFSPDYGFLVKIQMSVMFRLHMLHMVRCISHRGEITEVQFLNTKQNGCCIIFLKQAEVTQGLETRKQFLLG